MLGHSWQDALLQGDFFIVIWRQLADLVPGVLPNSYLTWLISKCTHLCACTALRGTRPEGWSHGECVAMARNGTRGVVKPPKNGSLFCLGVGKVSPQPSKGWGSSIFFSFNITLDVQMSVEAVDTVPSSGWSRLSLLHPALGSVRHNSAGILKQLLHQGLFKAVFLWEVIIWNKSCPLNRHVWVVT